MINFQIENARNKVEILIPSGLTSKINDYIEEDNIKLKMLINNSYDFEQFKSMNFESFINYHMCVIFTPLLFEEFKYDLRDYKNILIKSIKWSEGHIRVDLFILAEPNQYIIENNIKILSQFNMDEPDINLIPKSLYILNEALTSLKKLDTISASYNNRDKKITGHLREIEALLNNTRK